MRAAYDPHCRRLEKEEIPMKKMTRVLPLVALVALIAAIPASTQVVSDDEAAAETANLNPLAGCNGVSHAIKKNLDHFGGFRF